MARTDAVDLHRTCSECPNLLEPGGPINQKTCSPACRTKRTRRLADARKRSEQSKAPTVGTKAIQKLIRNNDTLDDAIKDAVRDELAPIVRAAITEDTLRAVRDLVKLTPLMVAAIEQDLTNPDENIRQKAYTLLARYTVGPVVAQPELTTPGMTVVFGGMVRPGPDAPITTDAPAVELRECLACGETKPTDAFVGHSDRCVTCHDKLRARAESVLNTGTLT